jgi:K+ transporter
MAVEAQDAPPAAAPGPASHPSDATMHHAHRGHGFWAMALGSVGIVFGDIGTSPLYAMREALHHSHSRGASQLAVLGVVSLMFWALTLIVTLKYVVFLMRADNKGEGGTLALMALAQRALGRRSVVVFLLGVVGTSLFYGDGIITPAISVLSAVEGLKAAPGLGHVFAPLVLPALTLNYMGQAALLLRDPKALDNPFFHLFPQAWLIPVVILATMATVIASQAVISGAFSMTRQAIQLGLLPRMQVVFTSEHEAGQIYLPKVNWTLLAAVMAAAIGFGSSAAMASAYGIAVTVTMLITTGLTFFVVRHAWKLPVAVAWGGTIVFFGFDALLVASCSTKFFQGGWFPIVMGLGIFTVMSTWKRGRELLLESIRRDDPELLPFIESLSQHVEQRAPRTAVFMVANPDTVPQALMHNLKHNCVLHEQNLILSVVFHERAYVEDDEHVRVTRLADGFWRVCINYGFMDVPDVPGSLRACLEHGIDLEPMRTSFFISRETVIATPGEGMWQWRERLYATMQRNAGSIVEFFKLPNNAVIELGTRVQI